MKKTKKLTIILLTIILLSTLLLTSCDIESVYYLFGENLMFVEVDGGYMVEPMPISTSVKGVAKKLLQTRSIEIPKLHRGEYVVGIKGFFIYPMLTNVSIPDSIMYVEYGSFGPLVEYNEYGNALYLGNENNPYVALIKAKDTSIYYLRDRVGKASKVKEKV